MYIRKIAAAAGFACGAALAFAPLAAAAPDPTLVTNTLDSEIAYQNSLFETYAQLGGVGADVVKGTPGNFDTIPLTDVPQATTYDGITPLESELYGANPIVAGISSHSGPFSEFNGALTQFENAYNVAVYAAANNGVLDTNQADYIENNALNHALTLGNPTAAENYLINFGLGDLKGYDAIFAPNATSLGDINPTIGNEIVQLNQLFELDARLTGDPDVFGDIAPHASNVFGVGFDTIAPTDTTTAFDALVFGAAGPSLDPGSYDVLNGAVGEFFNAFNVEDYALMNAGALLPAADIIGTHAEMATVAASVSEYLTLGFQDLLGYF